MWINGTKQSEDDIREVGRCTKFCVVRAPSAVLGDVSSDPLSPSQLLESQQIHLLCLYMAMNDSMMAGCGWGCFSDC